LDRGVTPAAADQKDSNGQLIVPKTAEGKKSVPVILVHGWNGAASTFTSPIDLFADTGDGGEGVKIPFSFIGQLQKTAGLAVYTFDYSELSNRWVTDPGIGPRLAQAIECLTDHYGTKAQIVAHSMGGLATRYALSQNDAGGSRISNRVSGVSTFGTPNTGSEIAAAVAAAPRS
jgi:triacylglycerol esterase/lipase EstA (alpha/beta hydrolase family)